MGSFYQGLSFCEQKHVWGLRQERPLVNQSLPKPKVFLILIPLFVSAFRRADELATAMECRCYRGGEGRTKLHALKYKASDFMGLVVIVLLCAFLVSFNFFKIGYTL